MESNTEHLESSLAVDLRGSWYLLDDIVEERDHLHGGRGRGDVKIVTQDYIIIV